MYNNIRQQQNKTHQPNKSFALIMLVVCGFIFLCLISKGLWFGRLGNALFNCFVGLFGYAVYPIFISILAFSILTIFSKKAVVRGRCVLAMTFMLIATVLIVHLATTEKYFINSEVSFVGYLSECYHSVTIEGAEISGGGAISAMLVYPLARYIGIEGAYIINALLFLVCVVYTVNYFVMRKKVKGQTIVEGNPKKEYPVYVPELNEGRTQYEPKTTYRGIPVQVEEEEYAKPQRQAYNQAPDNGNGRKFSAPHGELFVANIVDEQKYKKAVQQPVEDISPSEIDEPAVMDDNDTYLASYQKNIVENKKYVMPSHKYEIDDDVKTIMGENVIVNRNSFVGDPYVPLKKEQPKQEEQPFQYKIDINEIKKEYPISSPIISAKKFSERKMRERMDDRGDSVKPKPSNLNFFTNAPIEENNSQFYIEPETVAPTTKKEDVSSKLDLYSEKSRNFEEAKSGYDSGDDILNDIKNYMYDDAEKPQVNIIPKRVQRIQSETIVKENSVAQNDNSPFIKLKNYVFPPLNLLKAGKRFAGEAQQEQIEKSRRLEETLQSFRIEATVQSVTQGPTVTRYELFVANGVPVKKILAVADDIAMRLESEAGVRIQAPIPGKNLLGIEIPNRVKQIVSLKDVIDSAEFENKKNNITFALGEDIAGEKIVCDLQKMPHLLIAGSTGAGKSACLNSLLISMIYGSSPQDLRFILIDPKRVEFNIYNGLPHLLLENVICDPKKAISAFNWAINEMERRYELFQELRIRDIDAYNMLADQSGEVHMPKIVIIVDELADLLLSNKYELEEKIKKLTQKARAAGIHLVLATQRPSVDVITGVIKSNLPSRIAFRLPDPQSSKTVINVGGAEKLLGSGDMLYSAVHLSSQIRIQGAYVSTDEVKAVVDYVISHNESVFSEQIEKDIETKPEENKNGGSSDVVMEKELDAYFIDALRLAVDLGRISITMVQRKFSVGGPRAGKIVDTMEDLGYVSAQDGAKPREVLISREDFEELYGE